MNEPSEPRPEPPPPPPGRSRRVAGLVASAMFMENLDATVITTAVPAMAHSFGVAPVALAVGISSYLLALAVFIPISGWIADRYGPRQVLAVAILLFTLSSIACGFATSLPFFVAARVAQGIGGALMVPVGRLIVLRHTPKTELVRAIATITWPALAAPVLGPPLGGWIASTWGWHWIFFLNVPLGAVALVLALRWIDRAPGTRRPFDATGFVSSGAGLALGMYALDSMSHAPIDWPRSIGLATTAALLLAFAARHLLRTEHPLIDLGVFRVRTFRAAIVGGSMFRMALGAATFLLPLMFQLAFGFSMIASGFMMLIVFAGNLGIKPATGPILRRLGFRGTMLANGLLVAIGFVACAALSPTSPIAWMGAVMLFGGCCRSIQFSAYNTIAFSDTAPAQQGGASTMFSMFQQLSTGVGVAFGAIVLQVAQGHVAGGGAPGVTAFRIAFLCVTALTLGALVDALALPREAGNRVSGHGIAPTKIRANP